MTKAAAQKFIKPYYLYRLAYVITSFSIWYYLHILVMKNFDNFYDAVPMIFVNIGTYHLGLMVGFTFSVFSLTKLAYRNNFRLAYLVLTIAALIGVFNVNNIIEAYALISIIHGIGSGLYWQTINAFQLRELHADKRGHVVSIVLGWEHLLEIVIPLLAGFLVTAFSYQLMFALSIIVYLVIIVLPEKENPKLDNHFDLGEFKRLFRMRGFKQFELLTFVGGVLEDQRALVMTILPFLLIGNELDVGLFTSGMGLVAVFIVFAQRNTEMKDKMKFGHLGSFLAASSTMLFVFFWSVPALTIRNIVARVGFAMWTPVKIEVENQVQELVLKDFLHESAVEMSYMREVALFSARLVNLFFFGIIFYVLQFDVASVLKVVFFISAAREVLMLMGNKMLLEKLKIGGSHHHHAPDAALPLHGSSAFLQRSH
jgi:hypothetical protein